MVKTILPICEIDKDVAPKTCVQILLIFIYAFGLVATAVIHSHTHTNVFVLSLCKRILLAHPITVESYTYQKTKDT